MPASDSPSLVSLLRGTYQDYSKKTTELKPGDIVFQKNTKSSLPRSFTEHALVVGSDETGFESGLLSVVHSTSVSGSKVGNISHRRLQEDRIEAFRLADPEVRQFLVKTLQDRAKVGGEYSKGKALKSFMCGGEKGLSEKEKRRLVERLLREEFRSKYPEQSSKLEEPQDPEICSTFVGNGLIQAVLRAKLAKSTNSPGARVIQNKIEDLSNSIKSDGSSEEKLQTAVTGLLADPNFIQFVEFGTDNPPTPPSPIFQVDLNRMIPKDLIKFLLSHSSKACQLESIPQS